MIKSRRLLLRPLKLSDVYEFKNWGRHESVLYKEYDFLEQRDSEIRDWFRWKTFHFFARYYVILEKDTAIGYISFRNINPLLKSATLGLVIDPAKINQGLGEEALFTMLDYYFNSLFFHRILLKVAQYNKRALHIYKKMGFVRTSSSLMSFPNGDYDETNPEFYEVEDAFKIIFGKTFFYADRMELSREQFNQTIKMTPQLMKYRNEDSHVL